MIRISRAFRNVTGLAGSTILAQFILFVASLLLARVYTPEDFGLFGTLSATAVLFGTAATLRLEHALPIARSDAEARGILRTGLLVSTSLAGATLVLWYLIVSSRVVPTEQAWAQGIPLAVLVAGSFSVYTCLNQYAVRQQRFGLVAARMVLHASVASVAQIWLALTPLRPIGLILGLALGYLAGIVVLIPRRGVRREYPSCRDVLKRYWRFPTLLMPAGLLSAAASSVTLILIAALYGAADAGFFALAQRLVAIPVAVLGSSVAQVYLGRLPGALKSGSVQTRNLFYRATRALLPVAMLAGFGVALLSPTIFPLMLGPQWLESGAMARALALGMAAQIVASPVSQTLVVLGAVKRQLLWDAARVACLVLAVALAAVNGLSALSAVWLSSGVTAVAFCGHWLLSRQQVKRAFNETGFLA